MKNLDIAGLVLAGLAVYWLFGSVVFFMFACVAGAAWIANQ